MVRDGWEAACANPVDSVCLDAALRLAGVFPVAFAALASTGSVLALGWLAVRIRGR